jgi:hypothetical protein
MAYQYNIPLATDQLSKSQSDIQGNFNALGVIAGNGSTASSSLNGTVGFNYVYLASQATTIPAITFPAGNIALYSATNPITSKNELYINKTDQATVVQIPATASILSVTSAPALNSAGWTYLPSGILMKWGFVQLTNAGAPQTITYATGATIPIFTQVFNIQLTQAYASNTTSQNRVFAISTTTAPTTTGFTLTYSGSFDTSTYVYYLAIGY